MGPRADARGGLAGVSLRRHHHLGFGDTATPSRVSPNYRGSHQIPSVRRTAGVESSYRCGPKPCSGWVLNPSKGSGTAGDRGRFVQTTTRVRSECPRTEKGVGSITARVPESYPGQPAASRRILSQAPTP